MKSQRICLACRKLRDREELIKLTVDHASSEVMPYRVGEKTAVHGRSAYLCPSMACLTQAFKGTRFRNALEGRREKGKPAKRIIRWPFESQLIKVMEGWCTEP